MSKPVESFYKNLFEANRIHPKAESQQTEIKCFQEMTVCSFSYAFGIKENYMKVRESKVGIDLQNS